MSNPFSKHLHLCFFRFKCAACTTSTTTPLSPPPSPPSPSSSVSTSTTPTFLFNSAFSLYNPTSSSKSNYHFFSSSSSSDESDSCDPPPPPDFASVFASQRFFFSSPGHSKSIIPSPDTHPANPNNTAPATFIPDGCGGSGGVRVPKFSLNPYVDFRHSMEEMIESREFFDVKKDWDYLHELLLCYLALNPTHTHKFIVRAFTDLVLDLLSSSSSSSSSSLSMAKNSRCRNLHQRHRSFSGL